MLIQPHLPGHPSARTTRTGGWFEHLPADFGASLVVFLVALPLSMGIALASNASIMSGLIAAVVGGIVVGALGGAPLLVSGPAAGLAVMVFGFISELGFPLTCFVVAVSGLLQLGLGVFRVARLALAIAPAVIHGMLAGIGVLIVLGQLHIVLGGAPQSSALQNLRELPSQLLGLHAPAALLGLATIAILAVWHQLPPGKLKAVPGPLVAVLGVTLISVFWGAEVERVLLSGTFLESLTLPALPAVSQLGAVVAAIVGLTIVASAESLLSAVATDKLHAGPRARLDRELMAQGAANTLSGLVGGLPITGVIVRSAANVAAGARTRKAAILHGLWILLFVTQLAFLIEQVPLTVLAGLLVSVGARLVDVGHIRELVKRGEGVVYFGTLFGVVAINLLAGIGIGLALAAVRLLYSLGKIQVRVTERASVHHVHVGGSLTFLGVPTLTSELGHIPPGAAVDVDLAVDFIDHSGYDALESWKSTHEKTGGSVRMEALEEIWESRNVRNGEAVRSILTPARMAENGR